MLRLTSKPDKEISYHRNAHKLSPFCKNEGVKYAEDVVFLIFFNNSAKEEQEFVEALTCEMFVDYKSSQSSLGHEY